MPPDLSPAALPASQEEDEEEGEGEGEGEEEGEGEGLEEVSGEVVASGGRGGAAGWARSDRTDDPNDVSLFVFTASNPIRAACKGLAENKHFDAFIIFLIIFSSGCLALDAPRLDPTSPLAYWLSQLNVFFTIAFTVEATLKIIAYGFAFTPKAYLKSGWNVLDFSIVCVSLLCLFATAVPQLRSLRSLRTLRVLRPLRLLSRNPGMKLIITSLFQVMPAVGNVAGVVFALQLVFAILGLQLFMGGFGSCSDGEITAEAECQGTHGARRALLGLVTPHGRFLRGGGSSSDADDTEVGEALEWRNELPFSFDSFGATMLTLFVMATGDGWDEVMFVGMDSRGPGLAPQRNDMSASSLYFVAWIFVGCFFSLNLFIGAIVDTFTQIKKENDGSATMTSEQRQWTETMSLSMNKKGARALLPPRQSARRALFKVVQSQPFELFIMAVIICNVLLMACDYWKIEDDVDFYSFVTDATKYITYIYYVEATLKITAFGLGYFKDAWCQFDFFLVSTSLLDQFATELLAGVLPLPPMLLRVLRVFRILRILRLLKSPAAKGVRDLIVTMVMSLPALLNVSLLLSILMFMYAVLGVQLFTFVQHADNINDDVNFDYFGNALLLLLQCLTGDGWSAIMADAMQTEEFSGCTPAAGSDPGTCGSPTLGLFYFVSFLLLGGFVLLNIVVAVILETFATLAELNPELVSQADIDSFREVWGEFDPTATQMISATRLPELLLRLPPPMGLAGGGLLDGKPITATLTNARRFCLKLNCESEGGRIGFKPVLEALIEANGKSHGIAPPAVAANEESSGRDTPNTPMHNLQLKLEKQRSMRRSLGGAASPGGPQVTELARDLAYELMSRWVARRRADKAKAVAKASALRPDQRRQKAADTYPSPGSETARLLHTQVVPSDAKKGIKASPMKSSPPALGAGAGAVGRLAHCSR